ncbi:family 43 glycosylhydrolase [Streptococcus rifensis]
MGKFITNPFLPLDEYVPDGEPKLFGERVYIYGSHDRANGSSYCELDYVSWSAPKDDLTNWQYEGVSYRRVQDPENTSGDRPLFAPDVAQGPDGRYYLYYALVGLTHISVAVSEFPQGPFDYYGKVTYSDGSLPKQGLAFDPAILVDGSEIYLYYGFTPLTPFKGFSDKVINEGAYALELEQDMLTIKTGKVTLIAPGAQYSTETSFEKHPFFEASSIRKIEDWYYFVYSSIHGHELCYATSRHPLGPFEYKGVIISNTDIGYQGNLKMKNVQGNNHGGILTVANENYIFYHRHTHGTHYSRQACAEKIKIDKINGVIDQVSVTSCGLSSTSLPSQGSYSAGIACQMYNATQDSFPYLVENNLTHYVTEIENHSILCFKYFNVEKSKSLEITLRGGEGKAYLYTTENLSDIPTSMTFMSSDIWQKIVLPIEEVGSKVILNLKFQTDTILELLKIKFL